MSDPLISDLYHVLRASRRRHAITIIWQADSEPVSTRAIAEQITCKEEDIVHQHAATGEPYRNVYNALSQTHLPTLANARVVVYDPMRQSVSSGPLLLLAVLLISINKSAIDILVRNSYGNTDDTDPTTCD